MAYPGGYLSDEDDDDFDGFLSDDSSRSNDVRDWNGDDGEALEPTPEQKLVNMYYSIIHGNLVEVTKLIDSGLGVDVELQDNWRPLLLAASIGSYEIVHELIARGANVNDHRNHHTVLMVVCNCPETTASFDVCFNIVEELLHQGADVNATTRKRESALMFAAGSGNTAVLKLLLSCSNINGEDNKGWNALFWAVYNNNVEATQILLGAGLDSQKYDVCGNNPLYYATVQENEAIIKILSQSVEDTWTETLKTTYDSVNEFKDNFRPQFLQDILSMLCGMKCGNLQKLFVSVNLLEFLSMNEENLEHVGVAMPFQRNKILGGLYKFHKHLFKQKSIPVVPKNAVFSTIDVSHSILTAVRQLTVMEASLKYILKTNCNFNIRKNEELQQSMKIIRNKITRLKKSAIALNFLAKQWDESNKSVDLISNKFQFKWFKVVVGSSIIVGGTFFLMRRFQFY